LLKVQAQPSLSVTASCAAATRKERNAASVAGKAIAGSVAGEGGGRRLKP
jgi:hypothetical protein